MSIDLNVKITSEDDIASFRLMAEKLDIETIVATGVKGAIVNQVGAPKFLMRAELQGRTLNALRTQLGQMRKKVTIIAIPLRGVNIANFAAEESRVDVIIVRDMGREHGLKTTTAKLAAASDIALELPIRPLLTQRGLERSKILKVYREAVGVALKGGMQVVLSSGAHHPMEMRSADAFEFIGEVVGLDRAYIKSAMQWCKDRIARNERRLSSGFIAPGIEIVQGGDDL